LEPLKDTILYREFLVALHRLQGSKANGKYVYLLSPFFQSLFFQPYR
jgi:hypothetical protein